MIRAAGKFFEKLTIPLPSLFSSSDGQPCADQHDRDVHRFAEPHHELRSGKSLPLSLSILFDRTKSRFEHSQNDAMNVGGELGSGDAGYFSTSPQVPYQPATTTATSNNTTATQQLTPQTPNTPTIILTGTLKKKEKEGEEDWF